jgi:amidase
MLLLRAATASRMRDEDFSRQQEIAATLTDDDISDRAAVARGATMLHRAWGSANEMRTKLRYSWHEFFKRFDVLLTPVAATAAFPHNRNPNRDERNGQRQWQVGAVRGAVILCGAGQSVISAGNRSANRLDR